MPIFKKQVIIVFHFTLLPAIKSLIHHHKTHFIAQVKQFRRWRVMRSADTVAAHFFEHLQLALQCPIIKRSTQATQIVVIAYTQYLNRFSVKRKTLVYVKIKIANTEGSSIFINNRF